MYVKHARLWELVQPEVLVRMSIQQYQLCVDHQVCKVNQRCKIYFILDLLKYTTLKIFVTLALLIAPLITIAVS
jgi:hypothetical protein